MTRVAPVCSPRIAGQAGGRTLEQFLAENQLLHVKLEHEQRGYLWNIYARQCRIVLDTDRDLSFDTGLLAVTYAMSAGGVALGDIDMFAVELAAGRLVMPYDTVCEDGFGYYLKTLPEDLADPVIGLLRSWLISRFVALADLRRAVEPAA